MKISNDGVIHQVKTERIHYCTCPQKQIVSRSITFKLEYLSQSSSPEVIQSLFIEDWFKRMLQDRIIIESDLDLTEEESNFFKNHFPRRDDTFLVVENDSPFYITKILLAILEKLLPEIKIIYLEYELV